MSEESAYRELFNKYDTDKNGHLDMKELAELLKELALVDGRGAPDKEEVHEAFGTFDINQDGMISLEEFLEVLETMMK